MKLTRADIKKIQDEFEIAYGFDSLEKTTKGKISDLKTAALKGQYETLKNVRKNLPIIIKNALSEEGEG